MSFVAFSPDGRYALSGGFDKTVRLWDLNIGDVMQVAFSPDGLTGYSSSTDGSMRVWDLQNYISGNEL